MLKNSAPTLSTRTAEMTAKSPRLSHKKSSYANHLMKSTALSVLGCGLTLATGCSQDVHAPIAGEYGETLVNSVNIPADTIAYINNSAMPFPDQSIISPPIEIEFEASETIIHISLLLWHEGRH